MMEFYIIWLFTCQGWECKHFHSQKNFSMEMDPVSIASLQGGLKNTRAPLNAIYRSPCGTGKNHVNKPKTNVVALQIPVI